jgi:hypothetical protein
MATGENAKKLRPSRRIEPKQVMHDDMQKEWLQNTIYQATLKIVHFKNSSSGWGLNPLRGKRLIPPRTLIITQILWTSIFETVSFVS